MKIYFVVQRYGPDIVGGAESACRQFALRLAQGDEVTVFTTCAAEATTWANALPPGEHGEDGVRIIRFPTTSARGAGFDRFSTKVFARLPEPPRSMEEQWVRAQGPEVPLLVEEIRARTEEPDVWVFFTYLYYPTIFGLPLVARRAVLHPALHDEPPARLPLVRAVARMPSALALHAPEEWELVVRIFGWPPSRVRVVGLGVGEGVGDAAAFRSTYGLGDDPFLLYLARIDPGKGSDDLVGSFARFKGLHPGPLRLVLGGPVDKAPPPHDDVIVTGRLSDEDRWAAFESCTAFVHPSPFESFGLVLLEAWTKGKPAIVNARCPVTSGHARRARGGLAYSDPVEFEACLEALLEDPAAARGLGENGRRYAENFSWSRVIDGYRSFLEEVASAR